MLDGIAHASALSRVDHIYDSALEGSLFDTVMDMIGRPAAGTATLLYGQDTVRTSGNFLLERGLKPDALCAYMRNVGRPNPWFECQWAQMPGRVYQDFDLMPGEEFVKTEFYADWLSHQGHFDCTTGIVLYRWGTRQLVLEYRYPEHLQDKLRPGFTKFLEELAPHLVRAARISHFRNQQPVDSQFTCDILELLPFPILLLDPECRVQNMNSRADALLRKMEALFLSADGHLHAVDPSGDVELKSRVHALSTVRRRSSEVFALAKHGEAGHYFVNVLALTGAMAGLASQGYERFDIGNPPLALILQDGAEALELTHESLWRMFGLTSAEAELASSLLKGLTIGEYAAARAISKQTLRNQLASVMRKTDTCRQSQLVALLTRLAVSAVH